MAAKASRASFGPLFAVISAASALFLDPDPSSELTSELIATGPARR